MILIGPTPLAGIGQVMIKYTKLLNSKYYVLGQDPIPSGEDVFLFALPVESWFQTIPQIQSVSKSVHCMSICETETVHEDYGKLFKLFNNQILVPSEFCKKIFERQFPDNQYEIIRCYTEIKKIKKNKQFLNFNFPNNKYIFYHIGNIIDPRKNISQLIDAFYKCNFGDEAILVLKATCNQNVQLNNMPNVFVINGLIPEESLDQLHVNCNCYVSFSNSEGVGMGAVEAAIQDKPVIITEYGGAIEYINTPYSVPCDLQEIPQDDFLFQKGMKWGKPDQNKLIEFMKDAFNKRLKTMNHNHTRDLMTGVLQQFNVNVIGQKNNESS
ncbi:glycosyltransferase [Flavobacteriaceae bacterium]|nr:glycosyltransferase [Flavobacteriaceae bacterium]